VERWRVEGPQPCAGLIGCLELLHDDVNFLASLRLYGGRVIYSAKVLDHFQNPRNVGDLPGADAQARVENPACGDIMDLAIKVSDDRIDDIRFRTRGCVAAIAAGSCLTEMVKGRSIPEARAIKREKLVEALDGLPSASIHATHLAMDALTEVLKRL
jgi:nitrogen fixation protein NifU and related proteins